MLNNLKKKHKEGGFTIIEVMIVLAIAGLIMVVVFLAVPALQRSSRNQSRKSDVTNIVGSVSEYVSNNAGALPASNTTFATAFTNVATLGYYTTAANVTWTKNAAAPATPPTNTDLDKIVVASFIKCNGNNAVATGASSRSVAALYAIEAGAGGTAEQRCIEG